MFRMSSRICTVLLFSLSVAACGGEDSVGNDASMVAVGDAGPQTETGTGGVGKGRGGGALGEGDAAVDATPDASPDTTPDGPVVTPDAAAPSCSAKCEDIRTRYLAAVSSAKGCRTAQISPCGTSADEDLACGGCSVWVNSDTALKPIAKEWLDSSCGGCQPKEKCGRTTLVCPLRGTGFCKKNDTLATATVAPATAVTGTVLAPAAPIGAVIVDPIIIGPPILLNDGMCASKPILIQPL